MSTTDQQSTESTSPVLGARTAAYAVPGILLLSLCGFVLWLYDWSSVHWHFLLPTGGVGLYLLGVAATVEGLRVVERARRDES